MRTNLTSDGRRRFFNEKLCFCGKDCGFLDCFLGQKCLYWCVGDQNYIKNKSNQNVYLLLSKVDNIQKPGLSLKSCFFS